MGGQTGSFIGIDIAEQVYIGSVRIRTMTDAEAKIKDARNFQELYSKIKEIGGVKGTQQAYSPNDIVGAIESVRKGAELNTITRTYGLREKVKELRSDEEIRAAKDFNELYRAVERAGEIRGTQKAYSPAELKGVIEDVRHGEDAIYLTRSLGLREKVMQLVGEKEKSMKIGFKDLLSKGYRQDRMFLDAPGSPKVDEGFKVHVSADGKYAKEVKDIVLPLLQKEKVMHKIVESADVLEKEMTGTQRGKFITIYPSNDAEAVRVARTIDEALAGVALHGPKIPNDKPLPGGQSGLVYYRYGAFTKSTITGPNGEQVEDDRSGPAVPKWKKDIFQG
jgi:hypothetical protein